MPRDYDEPRDQAEVYIHRICGVLQEIDCDATLTRTEYIDLLETLINHMQESVDCAKDDERREARK